MARAGTTTKYEIVQTASEFFFTKGFSNTSPRMIAEKLGLSTGNITYYFKSKEHLLLTTVEELCNFQWNMLEAEIDKGIGSAVSVCLETMTVAVACEESEIARDFFIATFQSQLCRNHLRQNHVDRAKKIFASECDGWTDEQFHQAELLVMGLQYAAIVPTNADIPVKTRIAGALNQILSIYNVGADMRKEEIDRVLKHDCRGISKRVLHEFVSFVEKTNDKTLEQMMQNNRRKSSIAGSDADAV